MYGEGAAFVGAGMEIINQSVTATIKSSVVPPIAKEIGPTDSSKALKGERPVYFKENGDYVSTRIYDFISIEPGNTIRGPAVVEAPTTTFVIPPGQSGIMNRYGQLVVEVI